jgi:xylulokinase
LAGVGVGVWKTVDDACDAVVRTRDQVDPDENAKVLLAKQYQSYRALYPALRSIM